MDLSGAAARAVEAIVDGNTATLAAYTSLLRTGRERGASSNACRVGPPQSTTWKVCFPKA